MLLTMLKCKLHRVRVTNSELDYEGSCAIDSRLLEAAGLLPYEQIQVYNVTNGARFTTYVIEAERDSGVISVNGAAAHHAKPGDLVIIAAYSQMAAAEAQVYKPRLVYVDDRNKITRIGNAIPVQAA
jgi:aspartate 1-decarboxylase